MMMRRKFLPHHDTTALDTTPSTHGILDQDGETAAKCSEDTNPQRDLAQLQELFQQFSVKT